MLMNELYKSLEFNEILKQVANYCYFDLGKELVLNIRPSTNHLSLQRSLALTEETMTLLNLAEEYDLEGISDFSEAVEMAKRDMIVSGNDLLQIRNHSILVRKLKNKINKSEQDIPALKDLGNTITLINELETEINHTINNYGDVLDNASQKLKQLKAEQREFSAHFDKRVKGYINSNSDKLVEQIASERNGRVVVLIANTYKNKMPGIVHGESQSGQSVYLEPEQFIDQNNRRQSLRNLIQEEIDAILYELSQSVKKHAEILLGNLSSLAQFDATLAMARWGYDRQAIIATLNQDKKIYLESVAHPLIDRKRVVRNTYQLIDHNILIISGPNTGGKTVTLKTIGLSVLMTLCGLPIIADKAQIPIIDGIFVDLGDEQSVVHSLSTFSSHLTKLAHITNNVTQNSLVLLDELGGGTDPKEGEALALAILDYLERKEAIVVVTTHLAALKKHAQLNDHVILASVEFDEQSLMPTYRFIEGLAGQSNALEIAERFGIKPEIMNQAYKNKNELISEEETLMATLEKQERLLLQKEEQLLAQAEALKLQKQEIEKQQARIDHDFNHVVEDAQKEAERIVRETQEKMEVLYNEMKDIHGFSQLHEAIEVRKKAEIDSQPKRRKALSKKSIEVGDVVKVDNMNHSGEVVEINGKNITVVINGLKINTKLDRLEYVGKKKKTERKKSNVSVQANRIKSTEVNVIGKRVAEALIEVDRYLDSAVASNVESVRIVHGMGTGRLRTAIHDHLKQNKHVQSYKLAPQNQGGSGATIVRLK